jgi:hypothetical protein
VIFTNHNIEVVRWVLKLNQMIQQHLNTMDGEVLISSGLSSTEVCMKLFNMACPNFSERGGTNFQSRLLMGCVGSLVSRPDHSRHGREVMSLRPLLLRSQWQHADDLSNPLQL